MTALAEDRNTVERDGSQLSLPCAAAKKIYAGALVARDASGNATPGATATTLRGVGRAAEQVDNSSGIAGALSVPIDVGVFRFANSAGADELDTGDIGSTCYIVDDQTVAKVATGRSVAGVVFDVDSQGVWVDFR
jgi:hypothetical protein